MDLGISAIEYVPTPGWMENHSRSRWSPSSRSKIVRSAIIEALARSDTNDLCKADLVAVLRPQCEQIPHEINKELLVRRGHYAATSGVRIEGEY